MKPTAVYYRDRDLIGVVNVDPSIQDVFAMRGGYLKRVRCPELPVVSRDCLTVDDVIKIEECVFRYQRMSIEIGVISADRPDALEFWWPEHVLWKKEPA